MYVMLDYIRYCEPAAAHAPKWISFLILERDVSVRWTPTKTYEVFNWRAWRQVCCDTANSIAKMIKVKIQLLLQVLIHLNRVRNFRRKNVYDYR